MSKFGRSGIAGIMARKKREDDLIGFAARGGDIKKLRGQVLESVSEDIIADNSSIMTQEIAAAIKSPKVDEQVTAGVKSIVENPNRSTIRKAIQSIISAISVVITAVRKRVGNRQHGDDGGHTR